MISRWSLTRRSNYQMSRLLTFNNHEASDVPQGMDPLSEEGGRCVFVPAVMHLKKKLASCCHGSVSRRWSRG